jgi:hypothetical protein
MHEHGVFARFRYNDLKEAARDCGGRGPMQIQWWEGAASSNSLLSPRDFEKPMMLDPAVELA